MPTMTSERQKRIKEKLRIQAQADEVERTAALVQSVNYASAGRIVTDYTTGLYYVTSGGNSATSYTVTATEYTRGQKALILKAKVLIEGVSDKLSKREIEVLNIFVQSLEQEVN